MKRFNPLIWIAVGCVVAILEGLFLSRHGISLPFLVQFLIAAGITIILLLLFSNKWFASLRKKKSKLQKAKSLSEAIPIAFSEMPCGSEVIGPKGKIALLRDRASGISSGDDNTIYVMSMRGANSGVIFAARLTKSGTTIDPWHESRLKEWENKW